MAVRETHPTIPITIHLSASTLPSFQVFPSAISGFTPIVVSYPIPYLAWQSLGIPPENGEARGWESWRKEVRTRRQVIEVKDESRETVTDVYSRRSQ